MMTALPIDVALRDPNLLGAALGDLSTWTAWTVVLKAAHGRKLDDREREVFAEVAGGRDPPTRKVKELVAIASRRSGKGRIAGALSVHAVLLTDHSAVLAPGEVGCVACVSPTRAQAAIVLDYTRGYLQSSPLLRGEIDVITSDEIRLKNGNVISTLVSDYRSLRGRTLLLAVMDEAAFLRDEQSSTPDIECARALRPGLATTGGLLCILSSPYRRAGLLHQRHRDFFGKDSADVLVIKAASSVLNPTLDAGVIASAQDADEFAARSEWLGEFRTDIGSFLDDELIDSAIDHGRPLELPPRAKLRYCAFVDPSGGRGDSMAICIGNREPKTDRFVADVLRAAVPPFDPSVVVGEFARLLKDYGLREARGDSYGGEWVAEAFKAAGVRYLTADRPKSALYLESLPLWARGLVSIPDHPRLVRELRLLERRTHRSGKDTVDHGRSGHDDLANVLCGCAAHAVADDKDRYYRSLAWVNN
jgi:hypothetical protein